MKAFLSYSFEYIENLIPVQNRNGCIKEFNPKKSMRRGKFNNLIKMVTVLSAIYNLLHCRTFVLFLIYFYVIVEKMLQRWIKWEQII